MPSSELTKPALKNHLTPAHAYLMCGRYTHTESESEWERGKGGKQVHRKSHSIFAYEMYLRSAKHNNKHCKYFLCSCYFFFASHTIIFLACFVFFHPPPSTSSGVSFYYYTIYIIQLQFVFTSVSFVACAFHSFCLYFFSGVVQHVNLHFMRPSNICSVV